MCTIHAATRPNGPWRPAGEDPPPLVLLQLTRQVVVLPEIDLVEDVLFVPLGVAEVVGLVHHTQHAPLVVWVVVEAGRALEDAGYTLVPLDFG